jgi:hypothetical protein
VKRALETSMPGMTRNAWGIGVAAVCLGVFLGTTALPASSQEAANTSKPIPVKTLKMKPAQFEGTVMHSNIAQITVRGKENELAVRTFTLSPQAAEKMQQTVNQGGFQYGDRVKVEYDSATSTALKIKKLKPAKLR